MKKIILIGLVSSSLIGDMCVMTSKELSKSLRGYIIYSDHNNTTMACSEAKSVEFWSVEVIKECQRSKKMIEMAERSIKLSTEVQKGCE